METNKEIFIEFSKRETHLPIFHQPWWLDIVCKPNTWDVSVAKNENGEIIGIMPFMIERKGPFKLLRMPPLTPFLGVWIKGYEGKKLHGQYSYEMKVMDQLIKGLPDEHYFCQKFSPFITNWYPFYLKGFDQTTRYTYLLNDIKDHDTIWNNLKNTVRTVIRKAESDLNVEVSDDMDVHLHFQRQIFSRQNMKMPFMEDLPGTILHEAKQRNQGTLLIAKDKQGKAHASCFLVWDDDVAYNLMMGVNSESRSNGAVQFLLWEAIKFVSDKVDTFNFEGSMLPNVEPIFRHFGGRQTPYFEISRDKNRMIKLVRTAIGR